MTVMDMPLQESLSTGVPLTSAKVMAAAGEAFGGTAAGGDFTQKDASDVLEMAVNHVIADAPARFDPVVGDVKARKIVADLRDILSKVPTQTARDAESEAMQQFSTPPHYAYLAAWVANLSEKDVVLEPSAGVGGLAVHAANSGAKVYCNELSERRSTLLKALPKIAKIYCENAEQLHNILPVELSPSVVLMNPPFSASVRMPGQRVPAAACLHIEQALLRLADGGRLVCIVGRGMAPDRPTFAAWWHGVREKYTVRANIGIPGSEYRKYGTSFDTRLLVIDKCGATQVLPLIVEAESIEAAVGILRPVRDLRQASMIRAVNAKKVAAPAGPGLFDLFAEPAKPEPTAEVWPDIPADVLARLRAVEANPCHDTWDEAHCILIRKNPGITLWQAIIKIDPSFPSVGPRTDDKGVVIETWKRIPSRALIRQAIGLPPLAETPKVVEPERQHIAATELKLSAIKAASETAVAPLTDAIYEAYHPQRLKVEGAQPHPTPLVQSAAMASVLPPEPTYSPALDFELVTSGKLSEAQIEFVVYAGQAHRDYLQPQTITDPLTGDQRVVKFRRGFMCGDGTGVGKGRECCGIILDYFARGGRKSLWVSRNAELVEDATRDWVDMGGDPSDIIDLSKIKCREPIKASRGILFLTYGLLKSDWEGKKGKSRIRQIMDWLGVEASKFDGVIAFDESHTLKSALSVKKARGRSRVSDNAQAASYLQQQLSDARVVYFSATGATEVANLAYCDRLGLWGPGTSFEDKHAFVNQIEAGGVGAMELVARDMKALGVYMARNLSFGGVQYDRITHVLDEDQRAIYDKLCEAWQVVHQNIEKALEITATVTKSDGSKGVDAKTKNEAMSKFRGTQQRFFNQILTAMQMPSVIADIEKILAVGVPDSETGELRPACAVLQLVNTNEASLDRQLLKIEADEDAQLGDVDLTPRDQLLQMVEHSFPVAQMEEVLDTNTRKLVMRPVMDSAGKPVLNRQAVEMRDKLILEVASIRSCPDGPLEMIINHFGPKNVAEVTGRSRRVVRRVENGTEIVEKEARSAMKRMAETDDFQDGKRRILVFSDAGGTGKSYHASATVKNQARRVHYLIQPGWVADAAIQGFGRTHRSQQVVAPLYKLVSTDLKGQRRFISTIARRLDQLGALTKGQRQAASHGIFKQTDNLESDHARAALHQLYRDLYADKVEGITIEQFTKETGLDLIDKETGDLREELPPVTRFLNRMLAIKIDRQNALFKAYEDRIEAMVQKAMDEGTFDVGVETIRADKVQKIREQVVYTDPRSGAQTKHVELALSFKTEAVTFDVLMAQGWEGTRNKKLLDFGRNRVSGKVYAFTECGDRDVKGNPVAHYYKVSPVSREPIPCRDLDACTMVGDPLRHWVAPRAVKNWTRVEEAEAREAWGEWIASLPAYTEESLNLITGAVLPVWERLRGNPKVKRLATDEGERLLGRVIPEGELNATLLALGVKVLPQQILVPDAVAKLEAGTHSFLLANGWMLKPCKVNGERRIELMGPNFRHMDDLGYMGLFYEKIQYASRFFVPTGREAVRVLTNLVTSKPFASMHRVGAAA